MHEDTWLQLQEQVAGPRLSELLLGTAPGLNGPLLETAPGAHQLGALHQLHPPGCLCQLAALHQ